ncbi:MAG: hypothetical protein Q9219_004964 [cf. Caloplaca sp. 3 TL-2023]
MKQDPRTGQEVAAVLRQAGCPGVVLNACDSAKTVTTAENNLAEGFLYAGVPFVVAASAVLMEQTAEMFIESLYENLWLKQSSVLEAVHSARLRLVQSRQRRARFRQNIRLEDFAVPVLYENPHFHNTSLGRMTVAYNAQTKIIANSIDDLAAPIFGRGTDILELELRIATSHLLLLFGQGGIGKTALLKYCSWWWRETGFFHQVFYHAFRGFGQALDLATLQEVMAKSIPEDRTLIEAKGLAGILQQRRYLFILDELDSKGFAGPPELGLIKDFINSATQGDSVIIICGRKNKSPLGAMVPDSQHHCLSGLSMHGALQLAEGCTSWTTARVAAKTDQIFLERSLILLERNPLAIKLVFPALNKEIDSPEMLFYRLLYGSVNVNAETASSSKYLHHILMISMELGLKDEYNHGLFKPGMLAPFCTFFPRDLRNYFWFIWAPGFIEGTEIHRQATNVTFANWTQPEWQERVHQAMDVFGYGDFDRFMARLVDEDVLDRVQITYASGAVCEGYHINPVFTLTVRHLNTVSLLNAEISNDATRLEQMQTLLHTLNTAFVSYQILGSESSPTLVRKDHTRKIVWDQEIQHEDHCTNNLVAAYARSLDLNIVAEIKRHGMSTTDLIKSGATNLFWEHRRTADLLKPFIRHQILRLMIVVTARQRQREISEILDYIYLLTQAEEYEILDLIRVSLDMYDQWKAKGDERLSPATELSWFQVRHAEAFIAYRNGASTAKALFERNLVDDPVTGPMDSAFDLDKAIMRTQWQNLQGWIQCVSDERPNDPEALQGYGDFIKTIGAGKFRKFMLSLMKDDHPLHEAFKCLMTEVPLRDAWNLNGLLQENEGTVASFGTLAKSLFAKPLFTILHDQGEDLSGLADEIANDPMLSVIQDAMDDAEYALRFETDDMQSTMATLEKRLTRETSFKNTSLEKLDQIHDMMAAVAMKHHDWIVAIQQLDERWKLQQGIGTAEQTVRMCCQYIYCYARLPSLKKAKMWLLKAIAASPGEVTELCHFLEAKAPEVFRHIKEHGFLDLLGSD